MILQCNNFLNKNSFNLCKYFAAEVYEHCTNQDWIAKWRLELLTLLFPSTACGTRAGCDQDFGPLWKRIYLYSLWFLGPINFISTHNISIVPISITVLIFSGPSSALFPKLMAFSLLDGFCLPIVSRATKGRVIYVIYQWFKVMFLEYQQKK